LRRQRLQRFLSPLLRGQFRYRAKQLTAMTKRHPDFFEILVCQIRQDGETDVILGNRAFAGSPVRFAWRRRCARLRRR
jgi:hypothetical protein